MIYSLAVSEKLDEIESHSLYLLYFSNTCMEMGNFSNSKMVVDEKDSEEDVRLCDQLPSYNQTTTWQGWLQEKSMTDEVKQWQLT